MMPIYVIELDGKTYEIEGDRPPTEEEARAAIGTWGLPREPGLGGPDQSIPAEQQPPTPSYASDAARFFRNEVVGAGRGVLDVLSAPYTLGKSLVTEGPVETAKGMIEGLRSIPSEAVRLATEGSQEEIAQGLGRVGGQVVGGKVGALAPTAARQTPRAMHTVGQAMERASQAPGGRMSVTGLKRLGAAHAIGLGAGHMLVPGPMGWVVGEGLALAADPLMRAGLKGSGRILQRTGKALGFDPLLDQALRTMPVTTITRPRLTQKGGQPITGIPKSTLQTWGDVSPPMAPAPASAPASAPSPASSPEPVLSPVPAPTSSPILRESLVEIRPSKSHTSGRVPFAEGLTPNDALELGIDPTTGRAGGIRILDLKRLTPEAHARILRSRESRRGQHKTDAEILKRLREQEGRDR